MQFDVVVANPPFQDREKRNTTPHKLWIDFTLRAFDKFLAPGGTLLQVSPASFQSPSSKVLAAMRERRTTLLNFDVAHHFPQVGSTFAYYAVVNEPAQGTTAVTLGGDQFDLPLDDAVKWLPNDACELALSIHRKVMWLPEEKLAVQHDYVTNHNIRLGDTLSKTPTDTHVNKVFHTNAQTWWSSLLQDWASKPKVMWTRSGYTRPFADHGTQGGTDMVYFVVTSSKKKADALARNLNLALFRYIFRTAKWSGFGNEIVFHSLPELPVDRALTDDEMFDLFDLTEEERAYVRENS